MCTVRTVGVVWLVVAWAGASTAHAQDSWRAYRDRLQATPGLVRLYTFEGVTDSQSVVPNRVDKTTPLKFTPFKAKGAAPVDDLELTPGRWPGKKAVRLDQGWYEGEPFDAKGKQFTAECWFREHGAGTLQPRGRNGTLLSASTGYYDGWRITLVDRSRRIGLAFGRPKPVFAISTGAKLAPAGQWTHLAAVWDGRDMRLYVNGVERAAKRFDGPYTPAHVLPRLKVGFAGYGLGSFKLDVDLVALYDRALSAEEIGEHANPEIEYEKGLIALLGEAARARRQGGDAGFEAARRAYARIVAAPPEPTFPALATYKLTAALRSADMHRDQGRLDAARAAYAAIKDDAHTPEHFRLRAWLRLADAHAAERRYAPARAEYGRLARFATGRHEHWRVQALDRLADIEGLADGAAPVSARQRRIDRISHPARTLHVAPDGDDTGSGDASAPLRTLAGARDRIRTWKKAGPLPAGGVAVVLHAGAYRLSRSFELGAQDSGAPGAPIVYRAAPGERVCVSGGASVRGFGPVTDRAVLARLPEPARAAVRVADLKGQGLTDYGRLTARGYGRKVTPAHMELFVDGEPMDLARWPNRSERMSRGFVPIHDLLLTHKTVFRGDDVEKDLHFVYQGDRPSRWVNEPDAWVYGYWAVEYAAQYQKVKRIDTARRVIEIEPPAPAYCLRKGRPYYALNLLCELDSPGEYYVDRDAGRLYLWPKAPMAKARAVVSMLAEPLVVMTDASHVVLRGLVLEAGRADGIVISGGQANLVAGCTIRNLGNTAVIVKDGRNHAVVGCDIVDSGDGGIYLSGGDRKTLTPAGHLAENNHLHRFSRWDRAGYRSGLKLSGVGCRASHNLIHDCPHHAIQMRCNDHVLEYNELHDICYEAAEMGCYYIWAGLDSFSWRGNVLRYNFFHHLAVSHPFAHIRTGGPALHIDALNGALAIYGNVFHRLGAAAAFNGGGRDNIVENNIFSDCRPGVVMGDRHGLFPNWDWAGRRKVDMVGRLKLLPYQSPPWSVRYPRLANILADEPGLPKGNRIVRNVNVGQFIKCYGAAKRPECALIEDNWDGNDPGFADAKADDLRLPPTSPVFGRIGFEPIPFEKIGLYKDELRASWPVEHKVGARAVRDSHWTSRRNVPTCTAVRRSRPIAVDGRLAPAEWGGLDRKQAVVLERDPRHLAGATPRSWAWLRCDAHALYVGVLNQVSPDKALERTGPWGQCDGVEVAIEGQFGVNNQDWWVLENEHGPVFTFCGDVSGRAECLQVGGLPRAPAVKATKAVTYAAAVVDAAHWSAEWRIPFDAVCIDPKNLDDRPFNIGVRKTAGPASVAAWRPGQGPAGWVVWVGTGSRNWEVWKAGRLRFTR